MCGIVGYIGHDEAAAVLTPALKRLEYRGYDSAGLATIGEAGLTICKTLGKIAHLERRVSEERPAGHLGIGHTRWATHGSPSDLNAHPHTDCHGRIAVVHNGIIENYRELRDDLRRENHTFRSQTDTEVIAHLIERELPRGLAAALVAAAKLLRGSFAIACISESDPDLIVALRGGSSPLVVATHNGECFLASDVPALVGRAPCAYVLDDGEMAILRSTGASLHRLDGTRIDRAPMAVPTDTSAVEHAGYAHFMRKEIDEQPQVLRDVLAGRVERGLADVNLDDAGVDEGVWANVDRVQFIGCGTSWHAGLAGTYLVEELAGIPAESHIASELRHRPTFATPRTLVVPISQSGETADTLAAMRRTKPTGAPMLAICNVAGSSVARAVDGMIHTRAGIEIGVAATKSFTSQLAAVLLMAIKIGRARGTLDDARATALLTALCDVPALMSSILANDAKLCAVASRLAKHHSFLFLGRGLQYPLALEGALKLKELSYLPAEGYPAGEMKHGPIALIDRRMPVVILAPDGPTFDGMVNNAHEAKSRGGVVIAAGTRGNAVLASLADVVIDLPPAPPCLQPLLLALPMQLLAYHLAVLRGCDVDQPRNLAKSVTVE